MNITLIIGNGFDLQMNLQTKYIDFYEKIVKINDKGNQIYKEINHNFETWADFEKQLGEHTKKVGEAIRQLEDSEKKREVVEVFLKDLETVKKDLGDYIDKEVKRFKISPSLPVAVKVMNDLFTELSSREKDLFNKKLSKNKENNNTFYAINFNYTDVFDRLIAPIQKNSFNWKGQSSVRHSIFKDIVHIHGTLDEALTLGVNDEGQIYKDIFLEDDLYQLIKPAVVQEIGEIWDSQAEDIIGSSNIIIIYGMSLGDTDKKWWEQIGDWLAKDDSNLLLINFFDKNYISRRNANVTVEIKRKTKRRFLSFLSQEISEKIGEQIFIVINSKTFFPDPLEELPSDKDIIVEVNAGS